MKPFAVAFLCPAFLLFTAFGVVAQDDDSSAPVREVSLGEVESLEEDQPAEPAAAPSEPQAEAPAPEAPAPEAPAPAAPAPAAPAAPQQQANPQQNAFGAPAQKPEEKADRIVPFRVGKIYSAEITNKQPDIEQGESKYDKPEWENPLWVEVIVQFNDSRVLSRFDYALVSSSGTEYPCMCVKVVSLRNPRIYSLKREAWKIPAVNASNYYYLLFPVSPDEYKSLGDAAGWTSKLIPMKFRCKFTPTKTLSEVPIKIRVMPDGSPFSKPTAELSKGFCNLSLDGILRGGR